MFLKKDHKKKEKRIRVIGKAGVLYEGKLEELPLREEIILAKSEEFFQDPNPCYIHRGAVSIRLYLELEEALSEGNWELWKKYAAFEGLTAVEA